MAANKHPDRIAIVEAYRSGLSLTECADKFGLAPASIGRIVKKAAPQIMRAPSTGSKYRKQNIFVPEITGSILENFFSYDEHEGIFYHKTNRGGRSGGSGSPAGANMNTGYISIGLPDGSRVLAHRLAWLWMTGKWPETEIDHINQNRSDNRWVNLREATRPQNAQNGGLRVTNTSGRTGVSFDKARGKYVARIMVDYKAVFQKRFDTMEEAIAARAQKEKELFGEFSPYHHKDETT